MNKKKTGKWWPADVSEFNPSLCDTCNTYNQILLYNTPNICSISVTISIGFVMSQVQSNGNNNNIQ